MKEFLIQSKVNICSWDELTPEQQELVSFAKEMTSTSYCPYSRFCVGAALRLKNGVVVKGSNQENAAYPSGLCAERTALFAANANYPDQPVLSLAIASAKDGMFTDEPSAPCGACRQVILEVEHRYHQPIEILLYSEKGVYVIQGVETLLPLGFFAEALQ